MPEPLKRPESPSTMVSKVIIIDSALLANLRTCQLANLEFPFNTKWSVPSLVMAQI